MTALFSYFKEKLLFIAPIINFMGNVFKDYDTVFN